MDTLWDRLGTGIKFAGAALLLALPCTWLGLRALDQEWQTWQTARQEAEGAPIAALLVQTRWRIAQAAPRPVLASGHPDDAAALERRRRHQREMAELTGRVLHDTALSYDPSVDGYHLIIASFESLPELAERLSELDALGVQALERGLGEIERQQAAQLQGQVAELTQRAALHFELAAGANPALPVELSAARLRQGVDETLQRARQALLLDARADAAAHAQAAAAGQAALMTLSAQAQQALLALLEERERQARKRLMGLVAAALVPLLVGVLLLRRLARSVAGDTARQAESERRVVTEVDAQIQAVNQVSQRIRELLAAIDRPQHAAPLEQSATVAESLRQQGDELLGGTGSIRLPGASA